ncbi:hypothetical protein SAMN05216325_11312 [Nitrosomonas marina]|uniref:Uncharacterized protein n=1 Tax=Nitrosomonas marina TaxID=917 RepID=A0A1H8FF72_9PROT|nr:hypothetical protein SAMN05216325_11312 [Nitrosomonas marina]
MNKASPFIRTNQILFNATLLKRKDANPACCIQVSNRIKTCNLLKINCQLNTAKLITNSNSQEFDLFNPSYSHRNYSVMPFLTIPPPPI